MTNPIVMVDKSKCTEVYAPEIIPVRMFHEENNHKSPQSFGQQSDQASFSIEY